tara:strand:+ start:1269 stop:2366 length:1098 start_codon:yes stop_codon:yes gene_type:complete
MFKIPDEDIVSIVKKSFDKAAKEKGLIKETLDEQAQDFDKACGDIRNFPKFDITPNWGRTGRRGEGQRPETELLRSLFSGIDRIGAHGKDKKFVSATMHYTEKVQRINNFFSQGPGKLAPEQALSYIIIVDTFARLMDRELVNPHAAGRLAEAFFSAIFEGQVLGFETRNIIDVKLDADVELYFQETYSLKFVSVDTAKRAFGGSLNNLIAYFDAEANKLFRILVMVKKENSVEFRERSIQRPDGWSRELSLEDKVKLLYANGLIKMKQKAKGGEVVPDPRLAILVGEQYQTAELVLPDINNLREMAAASLNSFNESMAQIYDDLEHIKCYCNRYFVGNDLGSASKAKAKTDSLKQNVDKLTNEG